MCSSDLYKKRMEDLLAERGEKSKQAKERAFYGFLANLGANIAQAASKPGTPPGIHGIIKSTSEAGPASMQYANQAQRDIDAMDDANLRLNLEYQKLQIADRKNDKAAMLNAYHNITMIKQQQATLAEHIRHNKASEFLTGQHYASLANQMPLKMSALRLAADRQAANEIRDEYKNNPLLMNEDKTKGITPGMRIRQRADEIHGLNLMAGISTPTPITGG